MHRRSWTWKDKWRFAPFFPLLSYQPHVSEFPKNQKSGIRNFMSRNPSHDSSKRVGKYRWHCWNSMLVIGKKSKFWKTSTIQCPCTTKFSRNREFTDKNHHHGEKHCWSAKQKSITIIPSSAPFSLASVEVVSSAVKNVLAQRPDNAIYTSSCLLT